MKNIQAKCPVCKEWHSISPNALGQSMRCTNCFQSVVMIPRSSQARQLRAFTAVLIVLGGIILCGWLYHLREQELQRSFNSLELPDLSAPAKH